MKPCTGVWSRSAHWLGSTPLCEKVATAAARSPSAVCTEARRTAAARRIGSSTGKADTGIASTSPSQPFACPRCVLSVAASAATSSSQARARGASANAGSRRERLRFLQEPTFPGIIVIVDSHRNALCQQPGPNHRRHAPPVRILERGIVQRAHLERVQRARGYRLRRGALGPRRIASVRSGAYG